MAKELKAMSDPNAPIVYTIRVKGTLGSEWAAWFEGMTITLSDDGDTILTGPVSDQAALHGLLKRVRDLGIPLLALNIVESAQADVPNQEVIPGDHPESSESRVE